MSCADGAFRDKIYPRIMFAAPGSGSGKTVITCGFLEILKRRGIAAASFKCGPDYIDPVFHSYITGRQAVNLDSFFLGRGELLDLFEKKAGDDISVIEGVMGYHDGLAGLSLAASSSDIADCLDCPVIMILDAQRGGSFQEEELKSLMYGEPVNHIKGVILNRADEAMAARISPEIESLGLRFCGFVPECEEAVIENRHLGLAFPDEVDKFSRKISAFSDIINITVDIDAIVDLAKEASALPAGDTTLPTEQTAYKGTVAVARDEAFCFVYEDNLDLLREMGYEIITFSPLRDSSLPDGISALILGGGYPEVYADRLSANRSMAESVRNAFGRVKILAECGGFLYLGETLEGTDGLIHTMTGCIKSNAFRTGRSPHFGYISLFRKSEGSDSISGGAREDDFAIKAHEFHYWDSSAPGCDLLAKKPLSDRQWYCMYRSPDLLAGFPHLYYRSGPEFIRSFLDGEADIC